MERNISRIAFAVIGYATKALFILFAALFAMLAACLLGPPQRDPRKDGGPIV